MQFNPLLLLHRGICHTLVPALRQGRGEYTLHLRHECDIGEMAEVMTLANKAVQAFLQSVGIRHRKIPNPKIIYVF